MRDMVEVIEGHKQSGGINRYIEELVDEFLARKGFAHYDRLALKEKIKREFNLRIIDGLIFGPSRKPRRSKAGSPKPRAR